MCLKSANVKTHRECAFIQIADGIMGNPFETNLAFKSREISYVYNIHSVAESFLKHCKKLGSVLFQCSVKKVHTDWAHEK